METEKLKAVLEKYGAEVVAEIATRLKSYNKIASGNLLKSLKAEVREAAETVLQLEIKAAPYAVFVDKGRGKGKTMPPKKPIEQWMKLKNIPLKYSYPIRRAIGIKGIPSTYAFTISASRRQQQLDKKLLEEFKKSVLTELTVLVGNDMRTNINKLSK